MAGTEPGFSATEVKDAIHFAMNMGLPNTASEQATFYWNQNNTYSKQDRSNRPYNLNAAPVTTSSKDPVQVPVAVEFARSNLGGQGGTSAGVFDLSRATITLLDEDFVKVSDADYMRIGGNRYDINYTTSVGLFDVTVYQMFVTAWDES